MCVCGGAVEVGLAALVVAFFVKVWRWMARRDAGKRCERCGGWQELPHRHTESLTVNDLCYCRDR